jgi:hypothetical protein
MNSEITKEENKPRNPDRADMPQSFAVLQTVPTMTRQYK